MSARLVETLDGAAQFAVLHVAMEDPVAWKSELIAASGIED
jgi:hypothetical protein